MPAAQKITDLIKVTTVLFSTRAVAVSFSGAYVVATGSGWGTDRTVELRGSPEDVRAALLARGFVAGDVLYQAFDSIAASSSPPERWIFGKRDGADPSWTDTIDAVYASNASGYYLYVAETLSVAEIVEIATWCKTRTIFFLPTTKNADVYNLTAGNLAAQLGALAADVPDKVARWALGWRDSATATGAAAPTYTITTPTGTPTGTWDLRPAATKAVGGSSVISAQSDAGAVDAATLTGVVGTVTAATAGPFALTDGWVLIWRCDGVTTDYTLTIEADFASLRSSVETWNLTLVLGTDAVVVTDTGSFTWNIGTTVPPAVPAAVTAAELVADFLAAVPPATALAAVDAGRVVFRAATSGTASAFRFDAGGTNPAFITALALDTAEHVGDGNVADVAAVTSDELLVAALDAGGGVGTQDLTSGKLRLRGAVAGTSGSIDIRAGSSAGFLLALGLAVGSVAGTGNVPNLGAVTIGVLASILGAAWTTGMSVAANLAAGTLKVTGTLGSGAAHTLRWTGARAALGFPAVVAGAGSENDHGWARAVLSRASVDPDVAGIPWWDWTPVGVPGDVIPATTSIALRRDADVNTIENRSTSLPSATLHDGRLTGRFGTQPLYMDVRYALDWMAETYALELERLLEETAAASRSIALVDTDVRPLLLGIVRAVMARWAAARAIGPDYVTTPPTSTNPLGVRIGYKAEIATSDLDLRHWPVEIVVELAGKLQGIRVTLRASPS